MVLCVLAASAAQAGETPVAAAIAPVTVRFSNQSLTLGGELYKPPGPGPFPAVLYNHGSAPGMLSSQAAQQIGPLFAAQGWVFFMPYRRGQGLSADAGHYLGDEIAAARAAGGLDAAAAMMVRLLGTDHLQDQLAALHWLRAQPFVRPAQVATAGNSFGGIEVVLGASQASYCAAVDAAGGAESWQAAPSLQQMMKAAVRQAKAPILFFQAENDFDLSPSRQLSAEMNAAGRTAELKIYPAFGRAARDGHSFAYQGASIWFGDVFAFLQRHCTPGAATGVKP